MKRVILSMAAVAAMATALPAAAQGYGPQGFGTQGWGARFNDDRIEMRINQGIRDGSLTRREASTLRAQLRDARNVERAYLRDGRVNAREASDLNRRYAALNMRLRWERMDGENRNVRAPGYGYGNGYYR
jgi:Spy/CpxP family protein refolding chaperone